MLYIETFYVFFFLYNLSYDKTPKISPEFLIFYILEKLSEDTATYYEWKKINLLNTSFDYKNGQGYMNCNMF